MSILDDHKMLAEDLGEKNVELNVWNLKPKHCMQQGALPTCLIIYYPLSLSLSKILYGVKMGPCPGKLTIQNERSNTRQVKYIFSIGNSIGNTSDGFNY